MKSKFFRLLMLAGALFLSGTLDRAMAQVDSGRIIGQVLDAKGASIAGATVSAKNEATNEERTATSNTETSRCRAAWCNFREVSGEMVLSSIIRVPALAL